MESGSERKDRIRRLKKIIVAAAVTLMVIPTLVSIILGVRIASLKKEIAALEEELFELKSEEQSGIYTTASVETSAREESVRVPLEKSEEEEDPYDRQIYLTFDDGPSRNTNRILDILKEYDVKATFFVVGKTDEESVKAYQRIVDEGHTLAMHSYSHKYREIYESKQSFIEDLEKLQEYLYQVTGVWVRYYRFPGGSSNTVSTVPMQELITYLDESGITYFDWNISSKDAGGSQLAKDRIVENCVSGVEGSHECMILMHDASDKNTTVEALPLVIEAIRDRGDAVFLPITDDTVPVQHKTAEK